MKNSTDMYFLYLIVDKDKIDTPSTGSHGRSLSWLGTYHCKDKSIPLAQKTMAAHFPGLVHSIVKTKSIPLAQKTLPAHFHDLVHIIVKTNSILMAVNINVSNSLVFFVGPNLLLKEPPSYPSEIRCVCGENRTRLWEDDVIRHVWGIGHAWQFKIWMRLFQTLAFPLGPFNGKNLYQKTRILKLSGTTLIK
jgi:hypothetical protein